MININLLFFIFFGINYIIFNKLKISLNIKNISLFLFFLLNIFNSLLNLELIGLQNFLKSILLIKFFLFYIILDTLFKHNKIKLKYFFYIILFLSVFISLDMILQFTFGKNLIGYQIHDGRIGGMFGAEAIGGAFLQKLFIPSLIGIIFFIQHIKKYNLLFQVLIFISILTAIFISSNRISFILIIFLIPFIILLFKNFRKSLILSLVIIIPIFYYIFQNNSEINKRYIKFFIVVHKYVAIDNTTNTSEEKINLETGSKSINEKFYSDHAKIYYTALKSIKENILFGNGLKSFRYNCNKFLTEENTLCSTHPHNYHLEILHDTGLVGFFLLTIFVFSLLWKTMIKIKNKNLNHQEKLILALLVINLLIEIFPIKSTGSFFTTWNGTLIWITISLVNYIIYEKKNKY